MARTLTRRADARAQRRFHAAIVAGVVTQARHPLTALWIEAEHLVARLRWGRPMPPADELTEAQLDAAHEASIAEIRELADAEGLPDIPLAVPGEYMEAWGK